MLTIDRKLVFIDTETTSLDITIARPWEIALIERWPDGAELRNLIHVQGVDLRDADPESLTVGRFEERHCQDPAAQVLPERDAAHFVDMLTGPVGAAGAESAAPVLVGSNVAAYDVPVLAGMLARHGIRPRWYHHPIDLMTWQQGRDSTDPFGALSLRMSSYALSRRAGAEPPAVDVAHTAMGDAAWCARWWDALTEGVAA